MDLNLFRVFDAVYQQRSLTKAAEVLRLTQPAISHALSRLRDQFDDPLFVRQGHSMQPTDLAKAVVTDVRQALTLLNNSVQPRKFDPDSDERLFSLGLRDIMETSLVPELVKRFPRVRLRSKDFRRTQVGRALAGGDLDAVVDVWNGGAHNLSHQKLMEQSWIVLMSVDNPLSQQPLTPEQYTNCSHLMVSSRPDGVGWVDQELGRQGLARNITIRQQHYYPAAQTVANSHLLLTLPEDYGRMVAKACGLVAMDMPIEVAPLEVHLYWHERSQHDSGNIWLRQTITDICDDIARPV